MNRRPTGIQYIATSAPRSEEHWLHYDAMRRQKNWTDNIRVSHHRRIWNGLGTIEVGEEVMEWDTLSENSSNSWSGWNWNFLER